ncbi:hypothetical protein CP975_32215 [Streptomyces alboniger]|uniref:Uncharacterized protein n=1 Tax=Streptomyces alboniger TaxID=132473 RepID=A0A5J6HQV3_STRAD|nr:hypothetical protein CP975_32215 [Streptomyces alboniger]
MFFAALGGTGAGLTMALAGAPTVDAGSFGLALAAVMLKMLQQPSAGAVPQPRKEEGGKEQFETGTDAETGRPERG